MRISDWSSDVCSSDLPLKSFRGRLSPWSSSPVADVSVCFPTPAGASLQSRKYAYDAIFLFPSMDACAHPRSEEHTSELQSLMRISYAVFCLKKKNIQNPHKNTSRAKRNIN